MMPRATGTQRPPDHPQVKPAELIKTVAGDKARNLSPAVLLAGIIAGLFCLLLVWPFIFGAGWNYLGHPVIASADWHAAAVSIFCATVDGILMMILATPLAWILARGKFPGKLLLEALALVPLLTPPLAMGMLLAKVLGPESIIGQIAARFDVTLTNSIPALIIAGFYAAAPFYVFGAKVAFEAVHPGYGEMARLMGKSRMATWCSITLPLAAGGLFWALVIGWLRALGEFGVAIIIAYFPHGIPMQMWVNLQDSGPRAVYPLLWLLLLVAMPVPVLLSLGVRRGWARWSHILANIGTLRRHVTPQRIGKNYSVLAAAANTQRAGAIPINLSISTPVVLRADFTIRGITALTGPTGSGKTTLMRAIVSLLACDVSRETAAALAEVRIGYAPQQPLLFPHMTVYHNVSFGCRAANCHDRTMEVLQEFSLGKIAGKLPSALSAGQSQLASIARAVAYDADILLLDEPTAALDSYATDALLTILQHLVDFRNIAILLATHDREIARRSDNFLTISNSQIVTAI